MTETYKRRRRSMRASQLAALQLAVLQTAFQFCYTTVFGWLCSFLFIRTGTPDLRPSFVRSSYRLCLQDLSRWSSPATRFAIQWGFLDFTWNYANILQIKFVSIHVSLWFPAELISLQSSDFRISSGIGTLCIRFISLVKQRQ